MPTITGEYWIYDKSGNIKKTEIYTTDLLIGQRVQFVDNSVLELCHLNGGYILPAGTNETPGKKGVVMSYKSSQIAAGKCGWEPGYTREVEMPIVVRCDDGQIVYCNPLNIHPLPLHHD